MLNIGDRIRIVKPKMTKGGTARTSPGMLGMVIGNRPRKNGEVYCLMDTHAIGCWLQPDSFELVVSNN